MQDQSAVTNDYFCEAREKALNLSNRGSLQIDAHGKVDQNLLDAYWKYGFYVLKNVISSDEMRLIRSEFYDLLDRAPVSRDASVDSQGRAVEFDERQKTLFRFAKPLTDPYGGTDIANSRYQIKMSEPDLPEDAPNAVLLQIGGILQFLQSALCIYGHPKLLALTEAINGSDFTPFTEVIWLKQPRFGAAVSWHQDGTTQWDNPELDEGTHGFNFMLNLHKTEPENSLWVVPGSHKNGKVDLKQMKADSGSDRLDGAVPLLCDSGDVAICNRQIVHGSFPNTSSVPRYTFVFGFHRRSSVEGVRGWLEEPYDAEYIERSSRLIPLAIDARAKTFPHEQPYRFTGIENSTELSWSDESRELELKNYQMRAIGI